MFWNSKKQQNLKRGEPAPYILAYLHGQLVESAFMNSVTNLLLREDGYPSGIFSLQTGPTLCVARNELCQKFMENCDIEWLLMVDSDMRLPIDVFERLAANAGPERIVGGLCFSFAPETRVASPVMFGSDLKRIMQWERGSLVKVEMTGAACLLVHRKVLEKVPFPWFTQSTDGRMGEDVGFCINCRKQGIEIFVDTSLCAGHCKSVVIEEGDFCSSGS